MFLDLIPQAMRARRNIAKRFGGTTNTVVHIINAEYFTFILFSTMSRRSDKDEGDVVDARDDNADSSIVSQSSILEEYVSGSNLSSMDYSALGDLSIDYSALRDLSFDESSQSENGEFDSKDNPLLAIIEEYILGQRLRLLIDSEGGDDSSTSTCESDGDDFSNGASVVDRSVVSRLSTNTSEKRRTPKRAGTGLRLLLPLKPSLSLYTATNNESTGIPPQNSAAPPGKEQKKSRWWLFTISPKAMSSKTIEANGNQAEKAFLKVPVPADNAIIKGSSVRLSKVHKNVSSRDATPKTLQKPPTQMDDSSCSRDSKLVGGQIPLPAECAIDARGVTATNPAESTKSVTAPLQKDDVQPNKLPRNPSMASRTQAREALEIQNDTKTSNPNHDHLQKSLFSESAEETEIVFGESDEHSIGNDDKLWGNPSLWERWTPIEKNLMTDDRPPHTPQEPRSTTLAYHSKANYTEQGQKKSDEVQPQFLDDENIEVSEEIQGEIDHAVAEIPKAGLPGGAESKAQVPSTSKGKHLPILTLLKSPRANSRPPVAPKSVLKSSGKFLNHQSAEVTTLINGNKVQGGYPSCGVNEPVLCTKCACALNAIAPPDVARHKAAKTIRSSDVEKVSGPPATMKTKKKCIVTSTPKYDVCARVRLESPSSATEYQRKEERAVNPTGTVDGKGFTENNSDDTVIQKSLTPLVVGSCDECNGASEAPAETVAGSAKASRIAVQSATDFTSREVTARKGTGKCKEATANTGNYKEATPTTDKCKVVTLITDKHKVNEAAPSTGKHKAKEAASKSGRYKDPSTGKYKAKEAAPSTGKYKGKETAPSTGKYKSKETAPSTGKYKSEEAATSIGKYKFKEATPSSKCKDKEATPSTGKHMDKEAAPKDKEAAPKDEEVTQIAGKHKDEKVNQSTGKCKDMETTPSTGKCKDKEAAPSTGKYNKATPSSGRYKDKEATPNILISWIDESGEEIELVRETPRSPRRSFWRKRPSQLNLIPVEDDSNPPVAEKTHRLDSIQNEESDGINTSDPHHVSIVNGLAVNTSNSRREDMSLAFERQTKATSKFVFPEDTITAWSDTIRKVRSFRLIGRVRSHFQPSKPQGSVHSALDDERNTRSIEKSLPLTSTPSVAHATKLKTMPCPTSLSIGAADSATQRLGQDAVLDNKKCFADTREEIATQRINEDHREHERPNENERVESIASPEKSTNRGGEPSADNHVSHTSGKDEAIVLEPAMQNVGKSSSFRLIRRVRSHFQPSKPQGSVHSSLDDERNTRSKEKSLPLTGTPKMAHATKLKNMPCPTSLSIGAADSAPQRLGQAAGFDNKECFADTREEITTQRINEDHREHERPNENERVESITSPEESKNRDGEPSANNQVSLTRGKEEAIVLQHAMQKAHSETKYDASSVKLHSFLGSPVTFYPFLDFNPCREELLDDKSYEAVEARREIKGITVGEFFKANVIDKAVRSHGTTVSEPRTDTASCKEKLIGKRKVSNTKALQKKPHLNQQPPSTTRSSSFKNVFRRLSKHRVGFKDDLIESELKSSNSAPKDSPNNTTEGVQRLPFSDSCGQHLVVRTNCVGIDSIEVENEDAQGITIDAPRKKKGKARRKRLLKDEGVPRVPSCSSNKDRAEDANAAVDEPSSTTSSTSPVVESLNERSVRSVEKTAKSRAHHMRAQNDSLFKHQAKPIDVTEIGADPPEISGVQQVPSNATKTSVRFAKQTKSSTDRKSTTSVETLAEIWAEHTRRARQTKRHTVIKSSAEKATDQVCDETIATGGTRWSAISSASRLTTAEKKFAHRLANDIKILAKIEKKRSLLGQAGTETKANDIEKSLKLLQSIRASRYHREAAAKNKESTKKQETQTPKPPATQTMTQDPYRAFAGLFGEFTLFPDSDTKITKE
jgi:hypothetical protein